MNVRVFKGRFLVMTFLNAVVNVDNLDDGIFTVYYGKDLEEEWIFPTEEYSYTA